MIRMGFGLASDLDAVPKRSELARSAVEADFYFCRTARSRDLRQLF